MAVEDKELFEAVAVANPDGLMEGAVHPAIEDEVRKARNEAVHRGRVRSFLGKAALLGAVFVSAGTIGTMLHGSNTEIAGQNINTRETFDNRLTIHTGLPGSLIIPMDNFTDHSHGMGAQVRISDAPDASESDTAAVTSLFANVDPDVNNAENTLRNWFALYGLAGVAGAYAVSKAKVVNPRYKEGLVRGLGGEHRAHFALAAAITAAGLLPATLQTVEPKPTPNVSHVFDGTILEGATATGWMKELVNKVGVDVVNRIESINMYSGETSKNVHKAFMHEPKLFKTDGTMTVIGFEGLKCNPAVMPVIGEVIRASGADLAIDAGDEVFGQENLDKLCLDRLASQTKGTEIIVAPGNHRTNQTIKQAEDMGFTVLDKDRIIEKDGLTITGAPDPYLNVTLQQGPKPQHFPKRPILGDEVAQKACAQADKTGKQVSIGVMNQPGAANVLADSGCINTVITGGIEDSMKSTQTPDGETTYVFEQSAGGADYQPGVIDTATLGPPGVPINIYSYTFDKHSGKLLYTKEIIANPDYSVSITPPRLTAFASTIAGRKILFGS